MHLSVTEPETKENDLRISLRVTYILVILPRSDPPDKHPEVGPVTHRNVERSTCEGKLAAEARIQVMS